MSPAVHETISQFFERDHDEIDAILASVDFADPAAALPRLKEFDLRLERHIIWEESILFPAAGQAAPPLEHGPIAVMKQEHVRIRAAKAEALLALGRGDGEGAQRSIRDMLFVLQPHNMKEEQVLYPACDKLIAPSETERILARCL